MNRGAAAARGRTLQRHGLGHALPLLALGLGSALVAVFFGRTGLQANVLASFDESIYQTSAVHYSEGLPGTLIDDPTARGTARLYSLVVTPLFMAFEGDTAMRLSRALNAVFWAATALPLYVLARTVVTSRWAAVAAAVLSVAVPWGVISTILFSEALSYLLFAFTLLAAVRALEAPSVGREVAVLALMLALIVTRVQFVVLPLAWLAVVLWVELRREQRGLRAAWRRWPVLLTGAAVGAVGVLALLVAGATGQEIDRFAGPYGELRRRQAYPGDVGLATLWQATMLAVGVGIVPAVLAAWWFAAALGTRASTAHARFALLATTLLGVLFATTMFAQGGWIDVEQEERYYVYAVPLIWIGAAGALELRPLPARRLAAGGIVVASVLFVLPITVQVNAESALLGPVSFVSAHGPPKLSGDLAEAAGKERVVTPRDVLGYGALLVTLLGVLGWRRLRWLALVPAVAVQLLVGVYAHAGVRGDLEGIGGTIGSDRFADLAWVDRALPSGDRAAVLDNQPLRDAAFRGLAFWNNDLGEVVKLRGVDLGLVPFPVDAIGVATLEPRDDLSLPGLRARYAVTAVASPFFSVAGRRVATSRDGALGLAALAEPVGLTFLSDGVEPDAHIVRPVRLRALGGHRVTFVAEPPQPGAASFRVELGGRPRVVELNGAPGRVTFDLCDRRGVVDGAIDPLRQVDIDPTRRSAGVLRAVDVRPC